MNIKIVDIYGNPIEGPTDAIRYMLGLLDPSMKNCTVTFRDMIIVDGAYIDKAEYKKRLEHEEYLKSVREDRYHWEFLENYEKEIERIERNKRN